jgi:serine phosphatase RsbU (regulator of sigma subunit)
VADCTGHGVPGAMVSVVCSTALNRAVNEYKLQKPGEILNKTRELVIETFERKGTEISDGMDISLCALNESTLKLQWAGANMPLWIIPHNHEEVVDVKPDKIPIGKFISSKKFQTHDIQLSTGDTLYLISDGYADQFGGDKNKKFNRSRLKQLLVQNRHLTLNEQGQLLEKTFNDWKNGYEQVDDVCVMGVKV